MFPNHLLLIVWVDTSNGSQLESLTIASEYGNDKVVELLLTAGAKVDLQDKVIYSEDF